MASANKVVLVGNLGHAPSIRYSPDGMVICNVAIATTRKWKDRDTGQPKEETEWHRLVMCNRLAEIARDFLNKGRSIYVEGRLNTRKWQEERTEADRWTTEVIVGVMQMVDGRPDMGDVA